MILHLKNTEIHYEEIVPSNVKCPKTKIIFLHEALGSIGQWKSFPQEVCNLIGAVGIVYERQGHGASSKLDKVRDKNYLHNYALNELPKVISNLINEDDQIILVGHSDGGSIALLYSHLYPQCVKFIVTMAAHVINEPETIAGIQPAIDAYKAGKLDGLIKYHGDKTEQLFYAWADIWRSQDFKQWNITHEIGAAIPGLFIQGADDQYGTEKQLELIKEKFPFKSKTALIHNCGHHPHLEKQTEVLSLIKVFTTTI